MRTVERHITKLYGKIHARGKADATAYAIRNALVSLVCLRGIRQGERIDVAWLLGWLLPPAGPDWGHSNWTRRPS
jgi:hypothetical protein